MKHLFETVDWQEMSDAKTIAGKRSCSSGCDPRERLLAAAGQQFAEHGFESATIRDICLAAGVNVAAVNYYFGDKKRLYIESVKHAHESRMKQVPLPASPPDQSSADRLHDFIDNLLERMLGFGRPRWQTQLMLREMLQPTEACREVVEDYIRPHFDMLVSILGDLSHSHRSAADLRRIAIGVFGQCFLYRAAGECVGMLVPAEEMEVFHTPSQLADHIVHFTCAALESSSPRSSLKSSSRIPR